MDTTSLMLSLLFGMIGLGYVMFGRKAERLVPVLAGAALMVVPYFITNVPALVIVCLAIAIIPWVQRG